MRRVIYCSAVNNFDACLQYYQRMKPEDEADALAYINTEALEDMGYGGHTVLGWYEARPGYYDSLANNALQEVMLVTDGRRKFLGYVVNGRLYELEQQDIIDCLMDEDLEEDMDLI